jgi:hypothetical protein
MRAFREKFRGRAVRLDRVRNNLLIPLYPAFRLKMLPCIPVREVGMYPGKTILVRKLSQTASRRALTDVGIHCQKTPES